MTIRQEETIDRLILYDCEVRILGVSGANMLISIDGDEHELDSLGFLYSMNPVDWC